MMQDIHVDKGRKELRTIEIEHNSEASPTTSPAGKNTLDCNFGPDLSGSDEDEASEVDSFILDENYFDESERRLETSKFLLAAETDGQGIQSVDPQTQARLEALLEAAGISKLSSKDGKVLSDPEVLRNLTSSVSSALDEAAQALHRMRDSQGQLMPSDGMQLETNGESESIGHRSSSGNVADVSEEGESLLSLACSAGYYELAQSFIATDQVLLAMKANVEDRGIKGDCTPLMEAASGGHVDIVRLLLLHHADINAQSSAGNTPLHYGACGGFKDVVQELVMNGANVEIHNENGHTPLMEAASAGHVDVAKILLEHGAGINTHSNEFKESALTLACYKGHLDMVKFLLEAGADQEHKTDEMHTALMEASMDGHVEVARLLLDSGAQVNMPADSFESPLTLAACGGHIELASLLIERGANIEEVNDEGYTPLMEAAREGHEDMVALLLSQDADINAQTEETQETALTLACCGGFLEVADFLLRSGARIELGCSTPLMEAAQEGHLELVSFLLQSGASVEAQTGTGDTALTYACENGHTDVAEALLECGAKLEHESEGGRTPLMKAARAGHLCTVQFLISKGADVNRATTSNDHTVLSLACAGGHLTVVELLLQHGADINHKLRDGSTMVIEAAKGGHTQVVKLLLEWPNRFLVSAAADHLAQLSVIDSPLDEPRVPVQGLANIVPPSEPDSQLPLGPAAQGKVSDMGHQNILKSLPKRVNGSHLDTKAGSKFCSPENFPQFISESGLLDDKSFDKEDILSTNQATKEEQIQRKQQILEELKKVEQELQEKAHAQIFLSAQQESEQQHQLQVQAKIRQSNSSFPTAGSETISKAEHLAKQSEESTRFLELSSHTMGLMDPSGLDPTDIAKFLGLGEHGSAAVSCPDTCLQTVQAHLQQHQQQLLLQHQQQQSSTLQLSAPPPPPPTAALVTTAPGTNYAPENRGGGGGKIQGNKRSVFNKQTRPSKSSQHLQQPPPPPPPPPPSLSIVNSVNGQLLLPLTTQQQVIPQAQPAMYQTEHYGALQEVSQIMASTSQLTLDSVAQRQALTQPMHQQQQISLQQQALMMSQQQLLACPQLMQQELLLQQMLNQPNLQHQLQMQQNLQQGGLGLQQPGQHVLQGMTSTPMTTAPAAQLSQQQQQVFSQQQQQAQQLLQQQLQQLKAPSASGNHTIAINKPQVVRKQQKVQTSTHTVIHQNSIVNADGSLPPPGFQNLGVPGTVAGSLYSSVDVDSQTESNHDTALTLACAGGHAELVSLLLAKGADIEHRDKKGFTPLILSATAGHVDVVEILLDHSADIEAQSERTKDTPLSLACSGGRYEVVELLLNRGANKEHRNVSDYTPLSLAASGGYVNIIRLLLNYNAEINSRTGSKLGISPLMLAAMNGHTAAVKLLLDQGSDINAQIETNRNTALTLACFQGRHEVVSLLVDRKANIEHRAKTGLTPLMEAASGGYVEVGRVLLDKGADVNAPPVPSSRDTALTIAADKGHYRFVELLLHRGASVDVKNKKGNSPLWLACNGGHSDVVSLLVQADADIDSQDNRKVSCLMAAFRRGHIKVVKWMVKKVTQFPSENEIKRYIATITDKELQKKCNQCADVIVTAKDRQAAEANKNADSLLEEIKQEKEQAALKAEMASKRRERRRERKRKGKQKDEKTDKDKDSCKNSSPEPDGESSRDKREEDEEEEDEEDDSNSEPAVVPAVLPGNSDNSSRGPKVKNGKSALNKGSPVSDIQQAARLPPNMTPTVPSSTAMESSTSNGPTAATARATRDARKKQQKAARENRREASDQDCGLRNMKAGLNTKQISQALQVTIAKVSNFIESVVTVTAISPRPTNGSVTQVTSSTGQGVCMSSSTKSVVSTSNSSPDQTAIIDHASSKDSFTNAGINGGNKTRTKKSNEIMKQSSTTGIGDLDDFGVLPNVLKSFEKTNGKTLGVNKLTTSENKKDGWIEDFKYLEKYLPNMVNSRTSSGPSPRKGHKKEEGWKEVVRKNVSKKLSVPGNVISRLIGKGGCNINAIRELSGAHVEVEKSKGNADRTVTIKGYPEAIRHANNLINAMVEEPDKDISELLSRINKIQKAPTVEKVSQQKTPVSISDFAIGTFTVPVSSTHSTTSTIVKSTQSKSGKSSGSQSSSTRTSNSNTMGPTIGAWQNPVPGQVLPASPRRSPQKQVSLNSSVAVGRLTMPAGVEKGSARQLVFVSESGKRSTSPVSSASSNSASLSFSTGTTSSIRGVVLSSSSISSQSHSKLQEPRPHINHFKSTMAVTNPATVVAGSRFSRPSSITPRMEGMPLPIVTNGSPIHTERASHAGSASSSSQPPTGEYSPFNNNLFINFLSKKEEQIDKMDFASVAAAGIVTTSPSSQTNSNPVPASSNTISAMDPAMQAKAPWFKIPQQVNTPAYRPEADINMAVYRMSPMASGVTNSVQGIPSMNAGMMPIAPINPFMDEYQMNQVFRYQYLNQQVRENFNPVLHTALLRMEMGTAGLTMPPGVFPQGIPGIPMPPGQQQLPQKEEYSKPHRPMTLPEIKGGLNPNAPEFQLPINGSPMVNGFDRPGSVSTVGGMLSLGPTANIDSSSSNASPNPGTGLPNLLAGSMPPVMQSSDFVGSGGPIIQYLHQQVHPSGGGMLVAGGSPPQLSTNRLTSSLNMGPSPHNSPPQGLTGPPGLAPAGGGGSNFLSQSQPLRIHSPMHNLPGGRPNSAPSSQPVDPGMMGAPRSGSPLPTRAPPLDQIKLLQPIGGERKKGSGRPGPIPNAGSYTNLWGYNGSAVPGGNMVYPGMSEAEEEVMEYGLQQQAHYPETGDGDHNSMGQPPAMIMPAIYGNGSYPMAPIFPAKEAPEDTQTQPHWTPAMTSVPSDQGDSERWQSWKQ